MTECNGCGRCCDPVTLAFSQRDVQMMLPAQAAKLGLDARTREWVLHELTPISRREGLAMRPDLAGRTTLTYTGSGGFSADPSHFYRCSNFDPDTRLCTAYDDRPEVCRGYPMYGQPPRRDSVPSLPPECSFNADYGLPVVGPCAEMLTCPTESPPAGSGQGPTTGSHPTSQVADWQPVRLSGRPGSA